MKLITTLVYLSQAMRSLAEKARRKAITSIKKGLDEVESDLESVEVNRSRHMVQAHNDFYATKARLDKEEAEAIRAIQLSFDRKRARNSTEFTERRKCIALVAKGAVTELTKVRVALSRELDHLTK